MKKPYESNSYQVARKRAAGYANDPDRLRVLLDQAWDKLARRGRALAEVRDTLKTMLRLLRAYAAGQYREIPWRSLLTLIGAVVYFVMPFDVIPDFILGIGLLDNIAVIGWTLTAIKSDIDRFTTWEKTQSGSNPS